MEEIGDAEPARLVLAREREAGQLALAVRVVEDHVVALGGTGPIAVGGLRHQDLLADRDVEDAPQYRTQFVLRPLAVFGEALAILPVAPLELVEHALVEIGHDRLGRDPRDRPRPPEGRLGHRHIAAQFRPAQADLLDMRRKTIFKKMPAV
jgi:hypothetical protein